MTSVSKQTIKVKNKKFKCTIKRCLTEDVADQRYTAKEEKQYKSPFSFDFIFYPNLCDLP